MYEKLKNIRRHYEELSQRLSQPETYENMEICTRLQKEQNQLQPLMETFEEYERCLPPTFTACIPCMPPQRAGKPRLPT